MIGVDLWKRCTSHCVIDQAGLEHNIARAKLVAAWMFDQAKPSRG